MKHVLLASGSPRGEALLRTVGVVPSVKPQAVDETPLENESPQELVSRLSQIKAHAALENGDAQPGDIIIAADTTVAFNGRELGKPKDPDQARFMLHLLSGNTHTVSTGVSIVLVDETVPKFLAETTFVETAYVSFYPLSDAVIEAYIASGEPFDKAGSYGIQGRGSLLVDTIDGDYFTVVGLPLARTVRELDLLLERYSRCESPFILSCLGGIHA